MGIEVSPARTLASASALSAPLTMPVLRRARFTLLLVTGADKAEALA